MDRILNLLGHGWKTYVAGIGLILIGLAGLCDVAIPDLLAEEWTIDQALARIAEGLGLIGIRHKLSS